MATTKNGKTIILFFNRLEQEVVERESHEKRDGHLLADRLVLGVDEHLPVRILDVD